MERRARIPVWLGINWWWLLIFGIAQVELWHLLHLPVFIMSANPLTVWLLGQAWWVWRYSSRGRALYCLSAMVLLGLPNWFLFTAGHWFSAPVGLLSNVLWIAGLLFLAGDLRDYVGETEGAEPVWNLPYVWAILFNVFYVQYKFHELYEGQQIDSEGLTPGPVA